MKAKIRQDLSGLRIPALDIVTGSEKYIELEKEAEALQPHQLENAEYNVVLPELNVRVASIDLDFN